MNLSHKSAAVLLTAFAGAAAAVFMGQVPPPGQVPFPGLPNTTSPASPTLVVLDPAHGGPDSGAVLGDHVAEKDVTLALAARIRAALTSAGFTVVATRDADAADPLTTDQRAEIANRSHALACIVLHATATGSGVHVYTSELQPPAPDEDTADSSSAFIPTPWNIAQAKFVPQSKSLASSLTAALGKDHLPALNGSAPVRPLDNLMCPAIAVEMAPLLVPDSSSTPVTDANYQQQLASTLTSALRAWRDQGISPMSAADLDSQTATQAKAIVTAESTGHAATKAPTSAAVAPPLKGTR